MKSNEIISQLNEGAFNGNLCHIYGVKSNNLDYYKNRIVTAIEEFEKIFGQNRELFLFSAPGRSEILGNHTDHQHGKVLAAGINLDIIGIVSLNNSDVINLKSKGYDMDTVKISEPKSEKAGTSAAIIRGIVTKFNELNYDVKGFDCYTTSDVLGGSGLSSSAAFEIFVGTVINHLFCNLEKSPIEIAQIGQYAENNFFLKPSGLMDQAASSIGGFVKLDFKDLAFPKVESLSFDLDKDDFSLCVVDTHSDHANLTDQYAAIPNDMKKVANYFGCDVLREVDENDFYNELPSIRKKLGDRPVLRASHFFEEEKRVDLGFNALKNNDFDKFLNIILESGRSSFCYLQNVFNVNDVDNQGLSVALCICDKFFKNIKGGFRVHGGGFAGTIQVFIPNGFVNLFVSEMEKVFSKDCCYILKIRPVGGIKIIS